MRGSDENLVNLLSKKDAQKKATVYSTERINDTIKDIKNGLLSDMSPFYMGNTNFKDAGILFKYTDEELKELEKCAGDCVYFVENYCKFVNDKGRTLVTLRDYQRDILHLMSAEKWDDSIQELIPANKNIILLQSRQSGKCVSAETEVITDKKIDNKEKYSLRKYIIRKAKNLWKRL